MDLRPKQINDEAASTLSWNTFLSRTSVSSLSSATFSESSLSGQVHGLDDVLNTVKALSLRRFQYEEIERQDAVGEGETFVVERCVVRSQVLAIKHLKNKVSQDDDIFRRRLQSVILELRIMRHAPLRSHPNVLPVFGYGWNMNSTQIAPYILVQYAAYGTLRQYLRCSKPEISISHKEILLGDVAAATSALHLCGIIHGDIKLDNVLVFHSWDRPTKSIAKIADFSHSLVISGKEDPEHYMRYGGTFIYNAPEVHGQKLCPIDRTALHKCDIWAFGILTWETFLDGDEYVKYIARIEPQAVENGEEPIVTMPQKFLEFAKNSLPFSKSNLRGALVRSVLNITIQVDPMKRVSDLATIPFMSKCSDGVQGLKAELALHFGSSEWSYEMFRSENGKEIPWEHEEQIYQGLRRTYNSSYNRNNDAAWQLALCHLIGFGDSPNPSSAHQLALAAEKLNHPVAKIFAPLLAPNGPPESYVSAKTYAKRAVELLQQNKNVTENSRLMEACWEGDTDVIVKLLESGKAFDDNTEDGRNIWHLLFTLDDNPCQAVVLDFHSYPKSSLDQPTKRILTAHTQWPLRLLGSPLVFAISVGSVNTVRALLSLGANPCSRAFAADQFPEKDHRSKWTPIHIAVQYHCHEILSEFLKYASAVDYDNEVPYACALSYSSSLERIAIHGNNHHDSLVKTVSVLKETQVLSAAAPNGMTALMQAIDFQDADVVSALLNANNELARSPFLNPQNPDNFNLPIHFAAQLGARRDVPEAIKIIDIIDNFSKNLTSTKPPLDSVGRTPLHLAVTGPSKRASTWILERNPGLLNTEDKLGRTALHYCYSAANVNLLLSNGIDVNYTDKSGLTALHCACIRGNLDIVRCLLDKKPLLNLKNNRYGTALHCAVIRGSLDMTVALLEAGAPVDEVDQFGDAPLHVASSLCRHSIMRLLIRHEADIHKKDAKGNTAATIADNSGTMAGIATLRILQGDTPSQDTGLTEVSYAQDLDTESHVDALPVYQPRTVSASSEKQSREPGVGVGAVEMIDYARDFQADTDQDNFSIEAEEECESQGPERKLAEFVYYLSTQYALPLREARFLVRNLVQVFEITKIVNLDGLNVLTTNVFDEVMSGQADQPMGKASLLTRYLHTQSAMSSGDLKRLCDTSHDEHRIENKSLLDSLARAIAIILELGGPIWDVFGLDDTKASLLVDIGRKIDEVAENSPDVAHRFALSSHSETNLYASLTPATAGFDREDIHYERSGREDDRVVRKTIPRDDGYEKTRIHDSSDESLKNDDDDEDQLTRGKKSLILSRFIKKLKRVD
ncbi:hypothetical protein F4804DRAFT_201816 [Jackrogersella minutella]|nr:hypothetical protein F4804DRAFT_201816 [Jackrogersella minutella]